MSALVVLSTLAFGCSDEGSQVVKSNNENNNGTEDAGGWDVAEGDTGQTVTEAPTQATQLCAASGSSSGGGVTAYHCLGPEGPSGFEATGGGFVWQPGASRVILPKE